MKNRLIKKLVSTLLIFFVLFISFSEMSVVFAEETTPQTTSASDIGADLEWTNFLSKIRDAFNDFLYPILLMTGALIENDLLFGSGMEFTLTQIWIPIRNLVNILFVIVLIGIALYNILGLGEEGSEYAIKSALPKIVAALIIINFSFLGIKVMLDGVNGLTTAILAIPNDMGQKPAGLSSLEVIKYCEGVNKGVDYTSGDEGEILKELDLAAYRAIATRHGAAAAIVGIDDTDKIIGKIKEAYTSKKPAETAPKDADLEEEVEALKKNYHCNGVGLTDKGKEFFKTFNSRNAAAVLALNMTKFSLYDVPDATVSDGKKLATNAIFSLILSVVLVASFIALFLVLLFRIVFMWVAIAISPILILILFAPSIKDKFGGLSDIGDKFMKNAIAPIPIALALAIGWIMLKALQTTLDANQVANLGMNPGLGIPVTGLGTPQELMIMIGTITVIWLGVFGATEGTLAEGITETIQGTVQQVGKGLGTLPIKHLPTGVTHEGKDVKLGELGYALKRLPDQLNPEMTTFHDSFSGQKSVTLDEIKGLNNNVTREQDIKNIFGRMSDGQFKTKKFQQALKEQVGLLPAANETRKIIENSGYLDAKGKAMAKKGAQLKTDLRLPSQPRGVAPTLDSRTKRPAKPAPTRPIRATDEFKQQGNASATGLKGQELTRKTEAVNYRTNLENLGQEIDKVKTSTLSKTEQKQKIIQHIKTNLKVEHEGKTHLPSAEALKHSMGDRYNTIVGTDKLFKNDNELNTAIQKP